MKRFGRMGHILRVDLSAGNIRKEESDPSVDEFIGGQGLGWSLFLRELPPDTDALDPKSQIIFATEEEGDVEKKGT